MGRTLTLHVPMDLYEPLARTAQETGRTPEELAIEWLVVAVHKAMNDPVERFIGALSSNIPDWADQHDTDLGQSLAEELGSRRKEK